MSVVIPTLDRPHLLPDAVASALGQTHPAVEVVVVDDGSDPPATVDPPDPRVQVVRLDETAGHSGARNRGLAAASGEWVTFLDDDDELAPEFVERALRAAHESELAPPVAVLSGVAEVGLDGGVRSTLHPHTFPRGNTYALAPDVTGSAGDSFLVHNTLVVPTEVMRELGGYDERLVSWEHDDLFIRLNRVCSLQGIPDVMYRRRDHPGPRNRALPAENARSLELTLAKHRDAYARDPGRRAAALRNIAWCYLRVGRRRPALAAATRSLLAKPTRRGVALWLACLAGPRAYRALARRRSIQASSRDQPGGTTSRVSAPGPESHRRGA